MKGRRHAGAGSLGERFPPSPPCACDVCVAYCARPGWWTVEEAARAIDAGHARRMMLELAPDRSYAVLAPAFRGCEGTFALAAAAGRGCTFLRDRRCELYQSGVQPLECRWCHHARKGMGRRCHDAIAEDWKGAGGRALVARWSGMVKLGAKTALVALTLGKV